MRIGASVLSGLISGLIASVVTVFVTYEITFKRIEEPKLILEKKKIAIEANKQILLLIPNVMTKCRAQSIDRFTLRIACNNKNLGQYHVKVKINNKIQLANKNDVSEKRYGGGFDISFPAEKNSYILSPNSESDLWFYIKFNKNKYPDGLVFDDTISLVDLDYSTYESAQSFITQQFPETQSMVLNVSKRSETIFVPVYK